MDVGRVLDHPQAIDLVEIIVPEGLVVDVRLDYEQVVPVPVQPVVGLHRAA